MMQMIIKPEREKRWVRVAGAASEMGKNK